MSWARLICLTLTLISPLLWLGLVTRMAIGKMAVALLVALLWHWWVKRRSTSLHRLSAPHLLGGTTPEVLTITLLVSLLWLEGTVLWLGSPDPRWWQGLPIILLGLVGLLGLAPEPRVPSEARLPASARTLVWVGLGLAIVTRIGAEPSLGILAMVATLPVLLMPWSLPQLLGQLGTTQGEVLRTLRNLLLAVIVTLIAAGVLQDWSVSQRLRDLSEESTPWEHEWSRIDLDALAWQENRFPQPGSDTLFLALHGLAALRDGDATTALSLMGQALDAGADYPAVINAFCHTCGRLGRLGEMTAWITPSQIIQRGSLEAARSYVGALVAGDDFGRARVVHHHFGDALFTPDHPVLTPQRIGAAMVAWDRPDEAISWFSNHISPPDQVAESLFWRGLAREAVGEEAEARRIWQLVLELAPDHADAQAHLEGGATGLRCNPDLLERPVAGQQLVGVSLSPVSPEVLSHPIQLAPGQVVHLGFVWRLVHTATEPLEVRLRLGSHEITLEHLMSSSGRLSGDHPFHIGERFRTETTVRLPDTISTSAERAQIVVATPDDAPLPHTEVIDLAPLTSHEGFRAHNPRDSGAGISAYARINLFGRSSEALGVTSVLRGATSAQLSLDRSHPARELAVISFLSGGRTVPEDFVVAQVFISDQRGKIRAFPLLAGRHTADIWHEYPPYRETIAHTLAPVAWSSPRNVDGHEFENNWYMARFDLGEEMDIRAIRVRSLLPDPAELHVYDLVLIP